VEPNFSLYDHIPPQSYQIEILDGRIVLDGGDDAGLFYAEQMLEQIKEQSGEEGLPFCLIRDQPDFLHRGYMLDISRDRVPTMEHLFHLVDCLARLRYNELQLYTEHAFAYSKHETVWTEASPLTGDEIEALDAYCRERFIELVPNQNSFGHMERWLKHAEYHHLAECPDGFIHPLSGRKPYGSVLKPNDESLSFLDGLYTELLPRFSSDRFNIGGDEPWDLGQGWSEEQVNERGKHAVYADYLKRICELAEKHDVRPMVWADVLLEHPEFIEELPDSVTPILWGYEGDHPFDQQAAILSQLGCPYYVAPGDSTWNSFTGRHRNMITNVQAAAAAGLKNGASGFLMTHWGDNGHMQPWVFSLPGMVTAGLCAWNAAAFEPTALVDKLDRFFFGETEVQASSVLLDLADIEELIPVKILNQSFLSASLRLPLEELQKHLQSCSSDCLKAILERCTACREKLKSADVGDAEIHRLLDEMCLAIRLLEATAMRCLGLKSGSDPQADSLDYADLLADYKRVWLARSRLGGLKDSIYQLSALSPTA
jgi:hypothetical protein|tara:strand:- start:3998 stop:5620 length:1623 start_codon:yes stop_codon:yes gene_type:complete